MSPIQAEYPNDWMPRVIHPEGGEYFLYDADGNEWATARVLEDMHEAADIAYWESEPEEGYEEEE